MSNGTYAPTQSHVPWVMTTQAFPCLPWPRATQRCCADRNVARSDLG